MLRFMLYFNVVLVFCGDILCCSPSRINSAPFFHNRLDSLCECCNGHVFDPVNCVAANSVWTESTLGRVACGRSAVVTTSWDLQDRCSLEIVRQNHFFTTAGFDPTEACSYWPIFNLPVLSKLLERLVARQLMNYLTSSNLLRPLQSGFRPGHSTESAVLYVLSDVLLAVDRGDLAALALLNLSAAFDRVDYNILL